MFVEGLQANRKRDVSYKGRKVRRETRVNVKLKLKHISDQFLFLVFFLYKQLFCESVNGIRRKRAYFLLVN